MLELCQGLASGLPQSSALVVGGLSFPEGTRVQGPAPQADTGAEDPDQEAIAHLQASRLVSR